MQKPPGSIRDVARETGLSIATISRVMNGASNVSPKTRQRVLEASERLNYLPNPAARALSTSRSKTVAAIVPTIAHSVFAKFIAGIEEALGQQGYSLVLAISDGDRGAELNSARKLLGMGAEAFILSGADHDPGLIDLFRGRGVPFALTSIWAPDGAVPTIGYDNAILAERALNYLASMGHRRIAVLHGPRAESDRTVARRQGAERLQGRGVDLDYYQTELSVAGGRRAINQVLRGDSLPSAVLCFSDVLALGAYFGLSRAGLSVPGDISVMGFDNLDWARDAHPPLTTIDLPARDMGLAVAARIMDHLETGNPISSLRLEARIISRGSVRHIG